MGNKQTRNMKSSVSALILTFATCTYLSNSLPAPVENITWSYDLHFCDPSFKGAGTLHKALAPGANEVFATLPIANHTGRITYCPFAFNLSCLLHADDITLQSRYKIFNQSGYPDGFENGPNVTSGGSSLAYGPSSNNISCCFGKTRSLPAFSTE